MEVKRKTSKRNKLFIEYRCGWAVGLPGKYFVLNLVYVNKPLLPEQISPVNYRIVGKLL